MREVILEAIQTRLKEERAAHVFRVAETAKKLAKRYHLSEEKAELAALLHDIAKGMQKEELRRYLIEYNLDKRYLSYHPELWHAPVGALLVKHEFGIEDAEVIAAVAYHTTGRAQMSDLEKLIYVADMIEPGRNFPGVEPLRIAAEQSLEVGMTACIVHSIAYLVQKRAKIFPDSFECYNELVETKNMKDYR